MASSVVLNQVFLETSTAKSIKIRFTGVTDNTGQAISVWLPRSQIVGTIPDMYTIGDLGVTGWFWSKIKEKIDMV